MNTGYEYCQNDCDPEYCETFCQGKGCKYLSTCAYYLNAKKKEEVMIQ